MIKESTRDTSQLGHGRIIKIKQPTPFPAGKTTKKMQTSARCTIRFGMRPSMEGSTFDGIKISIAKLSPFHECQATIPTPRQLSKTTFPSNAPNGLRMIESSPITTQTTKQTKMKKQHKIPTGKLSMVKRYWTPITIVAGFAIVIRARIRPTAKNDAGRTGSLAEEGKRFTLSKNIQVSTTSGKSRQSGGWKTCQLEG